MSVGVLDMRATYTAPARSGLNGYARLRTQPPAIGEVAGDICELPTLWRATRPGQRQRTLCALPGRGARPAQCATCGAGFLLGSRAARQALADRHLGRVIRAYRCHPYHGRYALPQTVVAGWLGITQAQLSRVENGPPVVHLDRLAHWAKILGIPGVLLWFEPARRMAQFVPGNSRKNGRAGSDCHDHGNLVRSPVTTASFEVSTKGVVTTDRRQFHALAALAGLGSLGEPASSPCSRTTLRPSASNMSVLASSLVKEFRQADAAAGANQICDVAIHVHGRLSSWAVKARYSRDVGEALQASLADLAVRDCLAGDRCRP